MEVSLPLPPLQIHKQILSFVSPPPPIKRERSYGKTSMRARAIVFGIFWLLPFTSCLLEVGFSPANENIGVEEMVPLVEPGMMLMVNESRRKLRSFQICALCTCCGGASRIRYCLASPCCYKINCNIPNRPFGFCSFTPKTCNCFGCHF